MIPDTHQQLIEGSLAMVDGQAVFNGLITLLGALGGWCLRVVWGAVTDLQQADKGLADKVASIEILVAGNYVKRDELQRSVDALFHKLDRIETKLDGKVDK